MSEEVAAAVEEAPISQLSPSDTKAALLDLFSSIFTKASLESDVYFQTFLNSTLRIPLDVVINAPKVKEITESVEIIREALTQSKGVVLQPDDTVQIKLGQNTLILRNISSETPIEEVSAIFTKNGGAASDCPPIVSIRSDMDSWFVTFESEDDAKVALAAIASSKFNDKSVRARLKTERLVLSIRSSAPFRSEGVSNPTEFPMPMAMPVPMPPHPSQQHSMPVHMPMNVSMMGMGFGYLPNGVPVSMSMGQMNLIPQMYYGYPPPPHPGMMPYTSGIPSPMMGQQINPSTSSSQGSGGQTFPYSQQQMQGSKHPHQGHYNRGMNRNYNNGYNGNPGNNRGNYQSGNRGYYNNSYGNNGFVYDRYNSDPENVNNSGSTAADSSQENESASSITSRGDNDVKSSENGAVASEQEGGTESVIGQRNYRGHHAGNSRPRRPENASLRSSGSNFNDYNHEYPNNRRQNFTVSTSEEDSGQNNSNENADAAQPNASSETSARTRRDYNNKDNRSPRNRDREAGGVELGKEKDKGRGRDRGVKKPAADSALAQPTYNLEADFPALADGPEGTIKLSSSSSNSDPVEQSAYFPQPVSGVWASLAAGKKLVSTAPLVPTAPISAAASVPVSKMKQPSNATATAASTGKLSGVDVDVAGTAQQETVAFTYQAPLNNTNTPDSTTTSTATVNASTASSPSAETASQVESIAVATLSLSEKQLDLQPRQPSKPSVQPVLSNLSDSSTSYLAKAAGRVDKNSTSSGSVANTSVAASIASEPAPKSLATSAAVAPSVTTVVVNKGAVETVLTFGDFDEPSHSLQSISFPSLPAESKSGTCDEEKDASRVPKNEKPKSDASKISPSEPLGAAADQLPSIVAAPASGAKRSFKDVLGAGSLK